MNIKEQQTPGKNLLPPCKDSYVAEYSAGKNYGGSSHLFCNRFQGPGDIYRSLINSISVVWGNYIPPGSDIVSAKLLLHLIRNETREATTLSAYADQTTRHGIRLTGINSRYTLILLPTPLPFNPVTWD